SLVSGCPCPLGFYASLSAWSRLPPTRRLGRPEPAVPGHGIDEGERTAADRHQRGDLLLRPVSLEVRLVLLAEDPTLLEKAKGQHVGMSSKQRPTALGDVDLARPGPARALDEREACDLEDLLLGLIGLGSTDRAQEDGGRDRGYAGHREHAP